MKISILTPTYNRGNLLNKLYNSLLENRKYDLEIEWLIMDDGSEDETKSIVQKYIDESIIDIKYYFQKNQGKMSAINNLVEYSNGDLIIECDSDDFFTNDAFEIITEEYTKIENNKNHITKNDKENNIEKRKIYAMCFLKYNQDNVNMGKEFRKKRTTMFDLYYKEEENGEKALVFYNNIRKQYKYKLEKNEKFVTEARMYNEMDLSGDIICINKPIMICEYQEEGYTNNIINQFKNNPYGYYEYFKEIFNQNMKGITFKKRIYIIKHFILFNYLTKSKNIVKNTKGIYNKLLIILLYIPGNIISSIRFKNTN